MVVALLRTLEPMTHGVVGSYGRSGYYDVHPLMNPQVNCCCGVEVRPMITFCQQRDLIAHVESRRPGSYFTKSSYRVTLRNHSGICNLFLALGASVLHGRLARSISFKIN